jgi:NAD(P)-dependent dehydrogenase (short-subunit alcohol dehydrogenase family)
VAVDWPVLETRLFKEAVGGLGGLDVLVNNAGIAGPTGRVDRLVPEQWDRTLAVNITGQFNCARLAVENLQRSDNPSIVNLSSVAGRHGFAMRTPYAASEWAVVGFSKSLAIELGEFGIRVNAILSGAIDGPRIKRVFAAKTAERGVSPEDIQAEVLSTMSIKRLIDPSDIGRLIVFICSPMGRNISGQALSVCGDAQMLV